MNFPFLIARRYLFAKKSHQAVNIISIVSVVGVAIGTIALVIIMSVFNGFEDLTNKSTTAITIYFVYLYFAANKTFINAHLLKEKLVEVDSDLEFKYKNKFQALLMS